MIRSYYFQQQLADVIKDGLLDLVEFGSSLRSMKFTESTGNVTHDLLYARFQDRQPTTGHYTHMF